MLNKKSKSKILLIILIGISLPLYVLWKIVLVSFDYSSLGNPQTGVKITEQIIGNQSAIVLPEIEDYFFDKIEIKITLKESFVKNEKVKIQAYHNYLVSFYSKSEKIIGKSDLQKLLFDNNSTDVPIGGLFSSADAVNIMLPNDSYRTIFSAELFQKMGYLWEDLISKEVGFTRNLEEKELWRYGNAHSDGTILEVNNQKILVWGQNLFLVQPKLDTKKYSKNTPIKIDTVNPTPFDSCEVLTIGTQLNCTFEKEENTEKSNYVFIWPSLESNEIQEIQVILSTTPSWWSLKNNFGVSIDNIKLRLIKKYREHLPFI